MRTSCQIGRFECQIGQNLYKVKLALGICFKILSASSRQYGMTTDTENILLVYSVRSSPSYFFNIFFILFIPNP